MAGKAEKSRARTGVEKFINEATKRLLVIFFMLVFVAAFYRRASWVDEALRLIVAAVRWLGI